MATIQRWQPTINPTINSRPPFKNLKAQRSRKYDLDISVEGDKRLFDQYGVMLVNPEKYPGVKKELGQAFVDWLISPEGQVAIAGYKIDGQQLFFPDAEKKGASAPAHRRAARRPLCNFVRFMKPFSWSAICVLSMSCQ